MSLIPARFSASSTEFELAKRLAVYLAVSRTVRSFSSPPVCSTADTSPRSMA